MRSSPALDLSGNVFFGSQNHNFYGLDPSANPIINSTSQVTPNRFEGEAAFNASPIIGPEGYIYAPSQDGGLYVFDEYGSLLYELLLGDSGLSSPVAGADGTVYLVTYENTVSGQAYSSVWSIQLKTIQPSVLPIDPKTSTNPNIIANIKRITQGLLGEVDASPVLSDSGVLYIGTGDGYFYAIDVGQGHADGVWPQFRKDPKHQATQNFATSAPVIATDLKPGILSLGIDGRLSVEVDGTGPFVYQWYRNGVALTNERSRSLLMGTVDSPDAGVYHVTVNNGFSTVTSSTVAVAVVEELTIQPESQTAQFSYYRSSTDAAHSYAILMGNHLENLEAAGEGQLISDDGDIQLRRVTQDITQVARCFFQLSITTL